MGWLRTIFVTLISYGAVSPPVLPYVEQGVCPFEGCQYATWTALKEATVYDRWQEGRHAIASVAPKEKVTGLTGVVITFKPGVIRVDRDLPEQKLKRGDTILTYSYQGEGFSVVWVNGKLEHDYDISFTKWPDGSGCGGQYCAATYIDLGKKEWWAQVKLESGTIGWINMANARFNGTDGLAVLLRSSPSS
jgi:hypothetical protein